MTDPKTPKQPQHGSAYSLEAATTALQKLLSTPQQVVVTMHAKPDADAMGSALALANWLQQPANAHQVTVVSPTPYAQQLAWMPGIAQVKVWDETTQDPIRRLLAGAQVIFCVDFSELSRLLDLADLVRHASGTKVCLDHHAKPPEFARIAYWDPTAPATAVLLYNLIRVLGGPDAVEEAMAQCLYAGIVADTGSFQHPNTSAEAHRVAAALIDRGLDVAGVSEQLFQHQSLRKLRFTGFALSQRLTLLQDCNTAYFAIRKTDVQRFWLQAGDTAGLVNYALSLAQVQLAALLIEQPEGVHLSLRSTGKVRVDWLAQRYFSGGGHANAAGGICSASLDETVARFKRIVQGHLADFLVADA